MTDEIVAYKTVKESEVDTWHKVATVEDFPSDGGVCVEYKGLQVAVFNFSRRSEWYATQNLCPHKKQMILSRGMLGSDGDEPKVACPFHKQTFSLKNGNNLNGEHCALATYPVKVEAGQVYVGFKN
ncbi:MAG: nitrite reductase small subunit NirD [Reichenbachiella sp.]|uniref:nitrite reductase small subunit NirD n=1 Tax=Reichenbachiella sp. TaxID=2184521 RepID=UPI003264B0C2